MSNIIHTLDHSNIHSINEADKINAISALESGQVIHFPNYCFEVNELAKSQLLTDTILDGKHKNISYDIGKERLGGFNKQHANSPQAVTLTSFMQAYALFSKTIIDTLLPQYQAHLEWGRTSYRPAQILGRPTSKRKDDTRLHVDSFAASPVNGRRILRVFCNINPYGEPRVWHLGEPFATVANKFSAKIPDFRPGIAKLLHLIKATKSLRSAYDHYQLQLHDRMKLDNVYQQNVAKTVFPFEASSTWLVFTDHVSHAAISGQFLLEQTFYLPVAAMQKPECSPLYYWEKEKMAMQHA